MREVSFDGFAVEVNRQVLYEGEWDSPNCVWDWDTRIKYFFFKSEARRYFEAQAVDNDQPLVRLFHCRIQSHRDGSYDYDLGDLIEEKDA